jgi:hypothetical protein
VICFSHCSTKNLTSSSKFSNSQFIDKNSFHNLLISVVSIDQTTTDDMITTAIATTTDYIKTTAIITSSKVSISNQSNLIIIIKSII